MTLSDFATRNIKPILFSIAVLCLMGIAAFQSFPVSILPDVTFPRVIVIAESGERPISTIEASIARPIEEALTTVPNVKRIQTRTERGSTELSVDFKWGTDILTAENLVNAKVNEVRSSFPAETHTETERMNPTVFPVVGYTLDSSTLSQAELYNLAMYTIRPRLARLDGVSRIMVQGGRAPEIQVVVRPERLLALKLSLSDVVQAITNSNLVQAVGRVERRYQKLDVLVDGQANDLTSLGNIAVGNKNGIPILLKDVSTLTPSTEDRLTVVSANGHESVLLNVIRQPSANTVAMVAAVQSEIAKLKASLPNGTKLGVFYDQSVLVRDAIQSVGEAVLIGAVLAVVVLMLFLGNLRATLVTAAIIPMTVLVTFLLMRIVGLTLNLMTLGALAVGIGLVIDDAIVVVENVFKHLPGAPDLRAAVAAASKEIAAPMISSTLTTVVVFLPLSLLEGVAGAFFAALAITLTIAVLVSLALALLASPSLCAAFLKSEGHGGNSRLYERVLHGYSSVLLWGLKHKWIIPVAGIGLLLATVLIARQLGTGFMPAMDEGAFILDYTTVPGTSLTESDRILKQVDKILLDTPEVASFSRRTGTELGFSITEPNRGDYAVMLKTDRHRKIDDVIADVRQEIAANVAGIDVDFSQVLQDLIGDLAGEPAPIDVKLFGEDKDQLQTVAEDFAKKLGAIKGFADLKSGVVEAGPEYTLKIDPARAGHYGLSTSTVSDQAEAAMLGVIATKVIQGDRQVAVRVRYPESLRANPAAIEAIPIQTAGGFSVPLGSLGSFQTNPGAVESFRENQRRLLDVTASLEGIDLGTAIQKVKALLAKTDMPAGVTYTIAGQYESQQQSFTNLLQVLGVAILLVYAVMLFQFRTFTAPTVILMIMPLGLFGAVVALWLTGTAINVSSFMGAIMLVGIVVKNGILLLDRAIEAEHAGMPSVEAVVEAGRQRMRPILMTSLTAILGLFPLALGIGAGAEMQKPLAVTVIGGLTFSTLVTLIFAPVLYASLRGVRPNTQPGTYLGSDST